MNRSLLAFGAVVLVIVISGRLAVADPRLPRDGTRPPLGNNPYPVGNSPRPAAAPTTSHPPAVSQPSQSQPSGNQGARQYYIYYPGGYPYYGGAYGNGYSYPNEYYSPQPLYSGPLFVPAETMYGPESVKRFMGVDSSDSEPQARPSRPRAERAPRTPRAKANPPPASDDAAPADKNEPQDRPLSPTAVNLAWKFIGFGDAHFSSQKFSDAYDRYRKATRAAPRLADGWFRQGLALTAMGRYDLAASSLKRGLELDPKWPQSDFTLAELYGASDVAKKAHADALAGAAERAPDNADLLFLLGVHLYFDGERARASTFFQQAAKLAEDKGHLKPFMDDK